MKKILIFSLLISSAIADDKLMERIDSIVDVISQPRATVTQADVNKLKDPFVRQRTQTTGGQTQIVTLTQPTTPSYERAHFSISAIINDRAKINNRWLSKGETINGFTVQEIGANFARLSYQNFYTRVLYLNRADNNLIKGRSNEN